MSIFTRFFGSKDESDGKRDLSAESGNKSGIGLQVLFADALRFDPDRVVTRVRKYHPSMAKAAVEIEPELNKDGKVFGLIGWGKHVIQVLGFDAPMPAGPVENCVAPAHYPQDVKAQARAHKSHLMLWYAGRDHSPLEQYVALAAVAGVLSRPKGIVVLNEAAMASVPAAVLNGEKTKGDTLDLIRHFPLPILFTGFVKYNLEDRPEVCMRTYAGHTLGVPDMAAFAAGHHEGQRYFDLFENMQRYVLDSGSKLLPGHTAQVGPDEYVRFREPTEDEPFLDSPGPILVTELIAESEINRPR